MMCSGGAGTPKAGGNIGREWTHRDQRKKGGTRAKPRRGGSGDRSRASVGALQAKPSSWRTRQVFIAQHHGESGAGRPQGPHGDVKGRRGSSEDPNELLLRPTGCGPTVRENGVSVPSLEGQANTMSAVVTASAEANGIRTSNL